MTYSEYVDWLAFYSTEPFPEEREDFRNALLISTLVNLQRGKNRPVKVQDFMLDFWKEQTKRQTPQEMLASAKFIHAMLKGRKEKTT